MGYIYKHTVQYYETDQMGIVHHSNYIRWFESARLDMMKQMGISYRRMEEMGIISPVLTVSCEYKEMVHYDDQVLIDVKLVKYNGIKMELQYVITNNANGKVATMGKSSHCFLDKDKKLISLKKAYPEIHNMFVEICEN